MLGSLHLTAFQNNVHAFKKIQFKSESEYEGRCMKQVQSVAHGGRPSYPTRRDWFYKF